MEYPLNILGFLIWFKEDFRVLESLEILQGSRGVRGVGVGLYLCEHPRVSAG